MEVLCHLWGFGLVFLLTTSVCYGMPLEETITATSYPPYYVHDGMYTTPPPPPPPLPPLTTTKDRWIKDDDGIYRKVKVQNTTKHAAETYPKKSDEDATKEVPEGVNKGAEGAANDDMMSEGFIPVQNSTSSINDEAVEGSGEGLLDSDLTRGDKKDIPLNASSQETNLGHNQSRTFEGDDLDMTNSSGLLLSTAKYTASSESPSSSKDSHHDQGDDQSRTFEGDDYLDMTNSSGLSSIANDTASSESASSLNDSHHDQGHDQYSTFEGDDYLDKTNSSGILSSTANHTASEPSQITSNPSQAASTTLHGTTRTPVVFGAVSIIPNTSQAASTTLRGTTSEASQIDARALAHKATKDLYEAVPQRAISATTRTPEVFKAVSDSDPVGGGCREPGRFGQNCSRYCIHGCQVCSDETVCTTCLEGYFMKEQKCWSCMDGCSECNSTRKCQACYQGKGTGFYLDPVASAFCKPCISNCSKCSAQKSHQCQECDTGFTLDSDHQCNKCPIGCRECEAVTDRDVRCTECLDGYFLHNHMCKKCSLGCNKCGNRENCIECDDSRILYIGPLHGRCMALCPPSEASYPYSEETGCSVWQGREARNTNKEPVDERRCQMTTGLCLLPLCTNMTICGGRKIFTWENREQYRILARNFTCIHQRNVSSDNRASDCRMTCDKFQNNFTIYHDGYGGGVPVDVLWAYHTSSCLIPSTTATSSTTSGITVLVEKKDSAKVTIVMAVLCTIVLGLIVCCRFKKRSSNK